MSKTKKPAATDHRNSLIEFGADANFGYKYRPNSNFTPQARLRLKGGRESAASGQPPRTLILDPVAALLLTGRLPELRVSATDQRRILIALVPRLLDP